MCQGVQANLAKVQNRISGALQAAKRKEQSLSLIAISKFQSAEAVHCAALAGQMDFGENYLQEALVKQDHMAQKSPGAPIRWHFTGHIQSRKVKDVVGRFDLIHTVDSQKLAGLIEQNAAQKNIRQAILIQVNVGLEEQKSGIGAHELSTLTKYILSCPHIELQGLMCLPPVFDAGLAARPHFAYLRKLRQQLNEEFNLNLAHLSMGMSGDLEAAILEGATMVRVGTDIFGARASST